MCFNENREICPDNMKSPLGGLFFFIGTNWWSMITEREIEDMATPLLEGMNFLLVEMNIYRHRGDIKINFVLHKKGGINLDDLSCVQKLLRPRLELEIPQEKLALEISSPGAYRVIKNCREYSIFMGQSVKLLIGDDWMHGVIHSTDDASVSLSTKDGVEKIEFIDIRKGKLD